MAENAQLTAFLREESRGSETPAEPALEPVAPATPPAEPKPSTAAPEAPAKAPEPKAPEPDEDADIPVTGDDHRAMPVAAFEKARRDWKSKYAAEQAKAELLAKQLEEAKRPQPPQPQSVQQQYLPPAPDPNVDLVGYLRHQEVERKREMLNERLNVSEMHIREKIGAEDLDKYVADFKQHAERDPTLWGKLYQQPAPYQWMTKEIDRLRAHADIGDDPAAYRARIAAEERTKWEAEQAKAPAISPAAGLAPSLASVRSVAGRSAPAWTGETSLEDVVGQIRNRKSARR